MNGTLKYCPDEQIVDVLLYVSENVTFRKTAKISKHSLKFIQGTEHFDSRELSFLNTS